MGTEVRIVVDTPVLRRVGENHSERAEVLRGMAEELLRDLLDVPSYDGEFPGKMAAIGARVHAWLRRQAERLEEASAFLLGKAEAFELADQEVVQGFQGVQAGYEGWLAGLLKEAGPYGMVGTWFGERAELVPAGVWAHMLLEDRLAILGTDLSAWYTPAPGPTESADGVPLPPAPPGYKWERLPGLYTFSAFVIADERDYRGRKVPVPGIPGLEAREDFLYGRAGVGMQGSGVVWRTAEDGTIQPVYIHYNSGHWELGGERVHISREGWTFEGNGEVVRDRRVLERIELVDASFRLGLPREHIPLATIAASSDFKPGDRIYVPALASLTPNGGILEVRDTGGAFGPGETRFDMFVGIGEEPFDRWMNLPERSNAEVWLLVKDTRPAMGGLSRKD